MSYLTPRRIRVEFCDSYFLKENSMILEGGALLLGAYETVLHKAGCI